uniref:Uncharacterized protein n=1 Tax=Aegilops tauschii subsp. strangulata TaxID=200361 RepID=A0A453ARU3_AEGTS
AISWTARRKTPSPVSCSSLINTHFPQTTAPSLCRPTTLVPTECDREASRS